eukprot:jgi/Tetstr1/444084/TSEL_003322.t1
MVHSAQRPSPRAPRAGLGQQPLHRQALLTQARPSPRPSSSRHVLLDEGEGPRHHCGRHTTPLLTGMPSSESLAGRDVMTGVVTRCPLRPIHHCQGPRAGLRQNLFDDPLPGGVMFCLKPDPVQSSPPPHGARTWRRHGETKAHDPPRVAPSPQVPSARFVGRGLDSAPAHEGLMTCLVT